MHPGGQRLTPGIPFSRALQLIFETLSFNLGLANLTRLVGPASSRDQPASAPPASTGVTHPTFCTCARNLNSGSYLLRPLLNSFYVICLRARTLPPHTIFRQQGQKEQAQGLWVGRRVPGSGCHRLFRSGI